MKRVPKTAFEDYVAMGDDRSYSALARRYGVSRTAVANRARREDWQERLAEADARARQRAQEKAVNDLEEVYARHLKEVRFLQARALQVLKDQPPERGIRAASALAIAWKHELLLLGEPTERTASVEELIRHEMRTLLKAVRDDDIPEAQEP